MLDAIERIITVGIHAATLATILATLAAKHLKPKGRGPRPKKQERADQAAPPGLA